MGIGGTESDCSLGRGPRKGNRPGNGSGPYGPTRNIGKGGAIRSNSCAEKKTRPPSRRNAAPRRPLRWKISICFAKALPRDHRVGRAE
jgi:hypothetical protein